MRKLSLSLCALVALFAFAACDTPWPDTSRQNVLAQIAALEEAGTVTHAQAQAMREVAEDLADGTSWDDIAAIVAEIGIVLAGALLGVRVTRGPAKPLDPVGAKLLQGMVQKEKEKLAAEGVKV